MTETGQVSIGARFRTAREQSGISLRQIADVTKLSVRSLQDVEADRVARLPGGIYRRAIIRSFAREIGLDAELMLREFLAQHPDELPPLPPLPTRKLTSYDLPPDPPAPPRPRLWRTLLSVLGGVIPIAAGVFYFSIPVGGTASPAIGDLAVSISVSSPCDLRVVADHRVVVARRVSAGDRIDFNLRDEFVLSASDGGAVEVSVDGTIGRRLGPTGAPLTVRIGRDDYASVNASR